MVARWAELVELPETSCDAFHDLRHAHVRLEWIRVGVPYEVDEDASVHRSVARDKNLGRLLLEYFLFGRAIFPHGGATAVKTYVYRRDCNRGAMNL